MGKPCALCRKIIIDNKSYRKVGPFLDTLKSIDVTVDVSGVLCNICVYKLNKLNKYEFDIASKLSRMKSERDKLCVELRSLAGKLNSPFNLNASTPCTLAMQLPTPTPNLESMVKCEVPQSPLPGLILFTNFVSTSQDKSTQTKKDEEDFEVKVIVKYNGIERSRVVRNNVWKAVCKQIVNYGKGNMKTIAKDMRCKKEMINVVKSDVKTEVTKLVKKNSTVFRGGNKDLLNFNWSKRVANLQHVAPCLFDILTTVSMKTPHVFTAASVLMYSRCQRLSLLQYILALVLGRCGLTKEGLQLVHHMGLSMSPGSILKKKTDLVEEQKEKIKKMVTSLVKDIEKNFPPSDQENRMTEEDTDDLVVQQNRMIEDEVTDIVVQQNRMIEDEATDLVVQQNRTIEDEMTDKVVQQNRMIKDEVTDLVVQQNRMIEDEATDLVVQQNRMIEDEATDLVVQQNRMIEDEVTDLVVQQNRMIEDEATDLVVQQNRMIEDEATDLVVQQNRMIEDEVTDLVVQQNRMIEDEATDLVVQQNRMIEEDAADLVVQQNRMIEDEATDLVVQQNRMIKDEVTDLVVQQNRTIKVEATDIIVHQDRMIKVEATGIVANQEEAVSSISNDSNVRPIGTTVYIEKFE